MFKVLGVFQTSLASLKEYQLSQPIPVFWNTGIRIVLELLREDNAWGELAAHWVSVTNSGVLGFTPQGHHFAEVVKEADQVEPILVRMGLTDSLCCLEGVHGIGQVSVGVGLINQFVQQVNCIHDGHLTLV